MLLLIFSGGYDQHPFIVVYFMGWRDGHERRVEMAEAAEGGGGDAGGGGSRRLRRLLRPPRESGHACQDRPLLVPPPARKDGFATAAILRGLGCSSAAAAQAYAPSAAAVVRTSADWQAKPASCRRKKIKAPWKKARDRQRHPSSAHPRRNSAGGTELWCAPGIAFAASADDSVDCVVSQLPPTLPPAGSRGGRATDGDRIAREVRITDPRLWCFPVGKD